MANSHFRSRALLDMAYEFPCQLQIPGVCEGGPGEPAPEHIDKIAEWELLVAQASKHSSATFFAPGKDSKPREDGDYPGVREVVEWSRTSRGGMNLDLFFQAQRGGGCDSDLGLCESEAA